MDPLLTTSIHSNDIYDKNGRTFQDSREEILRKTRELEYSKNLQQSQQLRPSILDEIEKEFEGLSDDQKIYIYSDSEYQKNERWFAEMIQAEIIAFIKPRLLNNNRALELLNNQKDTIRLLKKQWANKNEKVISEFKEYTEKYSNMTYKEYLELKSIDK